MVINIQNTNMKWERGGFHNDCEKIVYWTSIYQTVLLMNIQTVYRYLFKKYKRRNVKNV